MPETVKVSSTAVSSIYSYIYYIYCFLYFIMVHVLTETAVDENGLDETRSYQRRQRACYYTEKLFALKWGLVDTIHIDLLR